MGTKYSSQSATGYNSSPPPDDGTQVPSNKITWAGILSKLTDVLKNFSDAINTAILTWSDFATVAQVANYTTVASDNGRVIECSGTFTVKLGDATTMGNDYGVTIKNVGTGVITITPLTGTDTQDGTAAGTTTVRTNGARSFRTNASANGYLSTDGQSSNLISDFISGGNVHLQFVSTVQIKLTPFNGSALFVGGSMFGVPSAGITAGNASVFVDGVAGQNLANSTLYYVYVFNNAGTLTIDFSTTGKAVDTTYGIVIKSGVPSRTLVGLVVTDSSGNFVSSLVRSWFNDHGVIALTANASLASNGSFPQQVTSISFAIWSGEIVSIQGIGYAQNTLQGISAAMGIGIDNNSVSHSSSTGINSGDPGGSANSNTLLSAFASTNTLSEGIHTAYLLVGKVSSASSGTSYSQCRLGVTTQR